MNKGAVQSAVGLNKRNGIFYSVWKWQAKAKSKDRKSILQTKGSSLYERSKVGKILVILETESLVLIVESKAGVIKQSWLGGRGHIMMGLLIFFRFPLMDFILRTKGSQMVFKQGINKSITLLCGEWENFCVRRLLYFQWKLMAPWTTLWYQWE